MKPFDLNLFLKGDMAVTRDRKLVCKFVRFDPIYAPYSMVVRIVTFNEIGYFTPNGVFGIDENADLVSMSRHQRLADSYKSDQVWQKKCIGNGIWIDCVGEPLWREDCDYRIKPESIIHCLAYDAKRFDHEQTTAVRARVVKKEVAQANGWKIIQEWEV